MSLRMMKMLRVWAFLGLTASLVGGHIDISPAEEPEPSFEYCIGPECPSNDEAASDEPVSEPPPFDCPSNETSFHPDLTDCHRYYICFEGNSTLHTCPEEMGYLPGAELCVSERFVQACNVIKCEQNGFIRDPVDCSKYYNCFFGHPYHRRCAEGTLFDPVSRRCSSTVPCLFGRPHNHNHTNVVEVHEIVL